jgi:outer membrane protein assembly factor BamB
MWWTIMALAQEPTGYRTEDGDAVVLGGRAFLHDDAIDAAAISSDGRHLWTRDDAVVRRWDLATGTSDHRFPVPCDWPEGLAVGPDGDQVAVACRENVFVLDAAGVVQATLALQDASELVWDGTVLGGRVDEALVLWSLKKDRAITSIPVPMGARWTAHDGLWLVSGLETGDDRYKLLALDAKGREQWEVVGSSVDDAAFSADGAHIAVALNTNATLLDPRTGKEVAYAELSTFAREVVRLGDHFGFSDGTAVVPFRTDGTLGKPFPLGSYGLLDAPTGAWLVDARGARARVFTADGERHLGGQGLNGVADGVLVVGPRIAAFTDSEAVIVDRTTGTHLPVASRGTVAMDLRPDGTAAFAGNEGVVLVDAKGVSRKVQGLDGIWGFDQVHFGREGRWLWAVSSTMEETVLTRIDVAKARLSATRVIGAHAAPKVRFVEGDDPALLIGLPDGRFRLLPVALPEDDAAGAP